MPPKLAPYPTLVGTAMTGALTRPPMTLASAPSMPATTMMTRAPIEAIALGEQAVKPGDADVVQPVDVVAHDIG